MNMMTLEQLRIFVIVAQKEHIIQASKELNLSQSAVSSAIGQLEEKYQIKFFNRIGRNIFLNSEGKIFLKEAIKILAQVKATNDILNDIKGANIGTISISCSQTIGNYWIAPKIAKYRKKFPKIEIQVTITNSESALDLVEMGKVDIGVIEAEFKSDKIISKAIDGDKLYLIANPNYGFIEKSFYSKEDIENIRFITRERGSGTRQNLEQFLAFYGLGLSGNNIAMVLSSNEAVLSAVEAGMGMAILSGLVIQRSLANLQVKCFDMVGIKREFHIIKRKDNSSSRIISNMIDLLSVYN